MITRKFTLQQNCNASCLSSERQQLLCQGRGYEADSTTATIGRRSDDSQRSHSAAELSPSPKTPSSLPSASCGVTVAKTASSSSRSLSQLTQSMSIQRLQPRRSRASQSNTKSRRYATTTGSPVINWSRDPAGGNYNLLLNEQ